MKGPNERGGIPPRRLPLLLVLALGVSLVLTACGVETPTNPPTPAPPTAAAATATSAGAVPTATTAGSGTGPVIEVTLSEWSIEPKAIEATAGTVMFKVTNNGKSPHNFAVLSNGSEIKKTKNLAAGATETLEVDLSAGDYQTICDIPGHKQAGMVGTLTSK